MAVLSPLTRKLKELHGVNSLAKFLQIEDCHMVSVTDPYGRILGFLDRVTAGYDQKS
jgi:hypothetical protein